MSSRPTEYFGAPIHWYNDEDGERHRRADWVKPTWNRTRGLANYSMDTITDDRLLMGQPPYEGGLHAIRIMSEDGGPDKISHQDAYCTDLYAFFTFLEHHFKHPSIANRINFSEAILYYERNKHRFRQHGGNTMPEEYERLDPKKSMHAVGEDGKHLVKNGKLEKLYEVGKTKLKYMSERLDPLGPIECENFVHFFNAQLNRRAKKEHNGLVVLKPPACSVQLIWVLELYAKSFNGPYRKPTQDADRINLRPETLAIDSIWNMVRALNEFVKNPKKLQRLHDVWSKDVERVGFYAWGALLTRLGIGNLIHNDVVDEHGQLRPEGWRDQFREDFLNKVERVGKYAAVAKSLFCLKERELEQQFLNPEYSELIFPYKVDIRMILEYPEYVEKLKNASRAETALAEKLKDPKIRQYLEWYKAEIIEKKYPKVIGYADTDYSLDHNNALSVETAYDQDFYIPAEGENQFVKYVVERFDKGVEKAVRFSYQGRYEFRELRDPINKKGRLGPIYHHKVRSYHERRGADPDGDYNLAYHWDKLWAK